MAQVDINLVFTGHVDHGKSTIIGRMLYDAGALPKGKLEQIKKLCSRNSKPFEYAFLLDALKDEQNQGITIDSARIFFKLQSQRYQIIDAPGHIEFLKNMVTGASRADCAVLVIDALEGVMENSKRHGYLLSMLGVKKNIIAINKMDLVDYDEKKFEKIKEEYNDFIKKLGIEVLEFIPVSGINGDNIYIKSKNMDWYLGKTLTETFMGINTTILQTNCLRLPIQAVYKFTKNGDDRRIFAGNVLSGSIRKGDRITFYPSGKHTIVKSLEGFNKNKLDSYEAPFAAGFTVENQIYIKRGEIAVKDNEKPLESSSRFKANIFWLSDNKLGLKKEYILKACTNKTKMKIEKFIKVLDSSDLTIKNNNYANKNDTAECIIKTNYPLAFDTVDVNFLTSRFVIVDNYEICGGGLITECLNDETYKIRKKVILRNHKWEKSLIPFQMRAERYNQRPCVIIITGPENSGKKPLAKLLEKKLFETGKLAYYLGIGNVLYGVDSDIKTTDTKITKRKEHIRRLSEVCHILLDAGQIVIVTAVNLTESDFEILNTTVNKDCIEIVWLGDNINPNINFDLNLDINKDNPEINVDIIVNLLKERGVIFNVW